MLQERTGQTKIAARTYTDAISIAPPEEQLNGELKTALRRARTVVEENAAALDAHLRMRLEATRARHADAKLDRFEECKDVALGRKKVFTQQPSMLHVPRLPAIQFYDNADFPWLKDIEAATAAIREELVVVLREDGAEMRPYVAHPDGAPVAQWGELNHSPRWSAFFLWEDGKRIDSHCARCPRTAALLDTIPMLDLEGFGPTVLFSILSPRTHIPPHSSSTNARLVTHLPVIVPPNCRFRVGNETRDWQEGRAWVFDDTIEHEAWNDSDSLRVILMIDIWNPYLTTAERELVTALLNGVRDYYQEPIQRP
jgi:aspartyl/asparaginyl beta-hydroxylase (cupin superfamily)